jgi:hypothetical protein
LVRCEGEKVFILRGFGDVLYEDVDVLLDIVLLDGNNVHEIGVFPHLWWLGGRGV